MRDLCAENLADMPVAARTILFYLSADCKLKWNVGAVYFFTRE